MGGAPGDTYVNRPPVTGRGSTHIDTAFMGFTSSGGVTINWKLQARASSGPVLSQPRDRRPAGPPLPPRHPGPSSSRESASSRCRRGGSVGSVDSHMEWGVPRHPERSTASNRNARTLSQPGPAGVHHRGQVGSSRAPAQIIDDGMWRPRLSCRTAMCCRRRCLPGGRSCRCGRVRRSTIQLRRRPQGWPH